MRLIRQDAGIGGVFHTWIGALLLVLGSSAAVLAIPEDVTAPGALTFSSYILALSLAAPLLPSMRNDTRSLLRGENILIGALIYWTLSEPLQGGYTVEVSREAVVREFILLSVTALGFWLGATLRRPLAPGFIAGEALAPWSSRAAFRILVIAFALGIWDFLYRSDFDLNVILRALLDDRWNSPWQRDALGDWSAFSYHLQYFGYLVPALTVLLAVKAGWRHPSTWIGVVMSATILAFHMQGGGRRIVGAIVLAGLFCWLIHVRRFNRNRFLVTVGALGALAVMLQVMLVYRDIGFGDQGTALAAYDRIYVDDNFLRIAQAIEFVPDLHPYVGWQYVLFALVRPVPRVFWPGKPVDGGFDLAELIGIPDTSFALTMAGELFVSYGFIAALLGGYVYGRLGTMVNHLFRFDPARLNPVFPAIMLVWLFVGVRSMLEIMLMGYVLLAVVVLSKAGRLVEGMRIGASLAKTARDP